MKPAACFAALRRSSRRASEPPVHNLTQPCTCRVQARKAVTQPKQLLERVCRTAKCANPVYKDHHCKLHYVYVISTPARSIPLTPICRATVAPNLARSMLAAAGRSRSTLRRTARRRTWRAKATPLRNPCTTRPKCVVRFSVTVAHCCQLLKLRLASFERSLQLQRLLSEKAALQQHHLDDVGPYYHRMLVLHKSTCASLSSLPSVVAFRRWRSYLSPASSHPSCGVVAHAAGSFGEEDIAVCKG